MSISRRKKIHLMLISHPFSLSGADSASSTIEASCSAVGGSTSGAPIDGKSMVAQLQVEYSPDGGFSLLMI